MDITTKEQISMWFDRGKLMGKDFMIIVCDTFSYEDFPVYCKESNFEKIYKSQKKADMQKIMEVYDLNLEKESQMNEQRAFHYPKDFYTMTTIIHCRQCGRNAEPKISTIASAKPIKKCGHCNSINYREATKDERLNVTPLPVKDEGLKIFGA